MSKRKSEEQLSSKERSSLRAFGEDADQIKIDFSLIPDHVRDELAATTLEAVRNFLRQPGGREKLDAITAARKEREAIEKASD